VTVDSPARRMMLALTAPAGTRHIVSVRPADVAPDVPPVWSTGGGIREPIPPGRGVRYSDACPVRAGER
jgi:hypothetical protein